MTNNHRGTERIVVVTGASRGAGRGIALALARDSVVYVTGRTTVEGSSPDGLPGTISDTAREVDARGGAGVPVACDHRDPDQVRALFNRVRDEYGHLDILVNNATALIDQTPGGTPFWERDVEKELSILEVGMISDITAAYCAAPLMLDRGKGLIVNTSSPGGKVLMPGVHTPIYGAGKAAKDKFTYDISHELRTYGVATISLWMGVLGTERVLKGVRERPEFFRNLAPSIESPEFQGRVIDALWQDPDMMELTGQVWWTSELAERLGVVDLDGTRQPSYRPWCGAPSEFTTVPSYGEWKASGEGSTPPA